MNNDLAKKNALYLGHIHNLIRGKALRSWSIQTSFVDVDATDESVTVESQQHRNQAIFQQFRDDVRQECSVLIGYAHRFNPATDKIDSTREAALFIPEISLSLAKRLARNYQQSGFIYSGPETDGEIALYNADGSIRIAIDRFHPQDLADLYTQLRGHIFHFSHIIGNTLLESHALHLKKQRQEEKQARRKAMRTSGAVRSRLNIPKAAL